MVFRSARSRISFIYFIYYYYLSFFFFFFFMLENVTLMQLVLSIAVIHVTFVLQYSLYRLL